MNSIRIEIKWALVFTAMMLLWMTMERLAGFHDVNIDKHYIISMFVMIPAITIYVLALKDKRKNYYNGRMSWMQGFVSGVVITLIVTLLTPAVQYITSVYITPDYFTNITRYSVEQKLLSQKEAEAMFNLKSYMVQATIGALIMGTATSAIVALFTKRK